MSEWIPGYQLAEGPDETGAPLRYRGVRDADGTPAWIRVDGFPADSGVSASAVVARYTATALFDHPLLPPVLDFGSTTVAGRAFIAFQLSSPAAGGGRRTRRGTLSALAEVQIAAADCGFAGVHLPLHELLRLREGARLEARHLPVHEFLCEPRGEGARKGAALELAEEETPFLPPEIRAGARATSARSALAYRLAAQVHVLLDGVVAGDLPAGDADKTMALSALSAKAGLPAPGRASLETDVPRELVRLGLSILPDARPDLEDFLAVRLPRPEGT